MEPAKAGAYQRAMAKRGPGLHHFAIDVVQMEEFLNSIAGSGWLLHPRSIKTIAQSKTAYLARPGFPALIEVQETETRLTEEPFVSRIEIPFDKNLSRLLPAIGLEEIVIQSARAAITLGAKTISIASILNPGAAT